MKPTILLNEIEAAELLNIRVTALRAWRYQKKYINFVKFGSSVRYRIEDLEKYLEESIVLVKKN